jgi:hypothetical protein
MFYSERITIYKEIPMWKRTPFKEILGVLAVILIMTLVAQGLKYLNPKPNVLEELEEKIKKVEQKEIVLTEPEKQLEKQATEKEWQEVDKQTDK